MIIGEVIGTVVSSVKQEKLTDTKLLIIQPLEPSGKPLGATLVAVDSVDAGIGDRVLVVLEGRAASKATGREQAPVEAACVGVIDSIEMYNI